MARARVTAVGSRRGAPAFEYEILGDDGAVLAVDYVVVHPLEGESYEDLAKLVVDDFLATRAAAWDTAKEPARLAEARLGGKRLADLGLGRTVKVLDAEPSADIVGREVDTKAEVVEADPVADAEVKPADRSR